MSFLSKFHDYSGLAFSKDKCNFIVGKSINQNMIHIIKRICGFQFKKLPIKYFGTPIYKGKKKNFLFEDIFTFIQKKLSNWSSSFLSFGGCLVLVKSVLNSISIYLFHTLMPSFAICNRLERKINKFFLGEKVILR
ncbi:Putative ribonuclease H protein [Dendrobium catenatum]|uniref:Ribonuclease H protein n=1 Tax=Dendrobium catenatum TaxID=906689 RepID=A0A2I0WAS2_9ASPA|nr:Putative ribonuclease H protein [Dendrobium catenatum]